jgi:hypothetical protein
MRTKSFLALSGLILFSVLNIRAQDFRFGILSGFNITRTNISEYTISNFTYKGDYLDPMASFNINGYIGYKSRSFWGLSLEPGYIKKGGSNPNNHNSKFHLNYIEMPILVNFYFLKRFYASVGPGISYLINEKFKYKSESEDIPVSGNKFEISGLIGLNYNIIKNIDIGLRYNQGWASINKKMAIFNVESKEVHQSIQLLLRLKI